MKHLKPCILFLCLLIFAGVLRGEDTEESVPEPVKEPPKVEDVRFLSAVQRFDGDFAPLEESLTAGADIMARGIGGWTALHFARDERLIPFLVKHGAGLEAKDAEGQTPLVVAVLVYPKCVKPFLEAGADVHAKTRTGCTPLHEAARRKGEKNLELIQMLLDAGAEVDARAEGDFTPLQIAVMNDAPLESIKLLLEKGAGVNTRIGKHEQYSILGVAGKKGNVELCRLLLKHGADVKAVDTFERTPLMDSVRYPAVCQLLLEKGAELDAKDQVGQTPLCYALQENAKTAELFIDAGADVNTQDRYRTPLITLAARMPDKNLLEKMVEKGADVTVSDINGETLLHFAAESGSVALCARLLEAGVDVNAISRQGYTPVMRAIRNDEMPAVEFLVTHGADLTLGGDMLDEKRWKDDIHPPLILAIKNRNLEMCKLLVRHGAPFLDEELYPYKTLCSAVQSGSVALCEYILNFNPDLEVRDTFGRTPLMLAAETLNLDMCVLLLSRGVDVNAAGKDGRNALRWVQHAGFPEKMRTMVRIYQLLLEAGADLNAKDSSGESYADLCAKMTDADDAFRRKFLQGVTGQYAEAVKPPALHRAAGAGNAEEVRRILADENAVVDVNEKDGDGETPIFHAVRGGNLEVVKLLAEHGAALDAREPLGATPLHYAAGFGRKEILAFLLEKCVTSADENDENAAPRGIHAVDERSGSTPLHWAVEARQGPCVIALVRAGADPWRLDKYTMSPFMRAVEAENLPYCKFFCESGCDINATVRKHPYEWALWPDSATRHLVILKECGMDFNTRDARGHTLLHYLAMRKEVRMMEYVMRNGGDPALKNDRGETPVEVLSRYGTPANWMSRMRELEKEVAEKEK